MSFELETAIEITDEQIFNCLDAGYRVINGIRIKLGCGIESLQYKLDEMVDENEMQRLRSGGVFAYFRNDEHPARFYLIGGGKVRVEWAGDDEPQEEKEMEKAAIPQQPAISNGKGHHGPGRGNIIVFSAERLEELASTETSKLAVAKALGYGNSCTPLDRRMKLDPQLKAAYDRGCAKRNGSAPRKRGPYKAATKKEISVKTPSHQVQQATEIPTQELENVHIREVSNPVSHRFINLSRGGQLLVGYEGSVFDLTSGDWQLIEQITSLMNKFEASKR
jgi:hypothetical protein